MASFGIRNLQPAHPFSSSIVDSFTQWRHFLEGSSHQVMEYENQRSLGVFLLEPKRHGEELLKDNSTTTQAHLRRTIATLFSSINPTNVASQWRDTKIVSQPRHNKGVTIDRAISKILSSRGPDPMNHNLTTLCHQWINAIISCHHRCFPCFPRLRDRAPFWIDLCERYLEDKRYHISNLRITHVPKTRFFSLLLSYLLLYLLGDIYFILICCSQRRDNTQDVISCLAS